MHIPARHARVNWLKRRRGVATVLLCATMVLAACGGGSSSDTPDDDDRRFVTDRPTTTATAVTTASPIAETTAPTAVPTINPEQLLVPRGAPRFLYLVIDGALHAYDANARTFTPVALPGGVTMLDYTSSPTGDRVGILGWQDGKVSVQFFGADGEPLSDPIMLPIRYALPLVASPVATPVASPMATPAVSSTPQLNIDWVPQGNAVLVSGPGVLHRVSMNGTIMPVSRTGATGTVINAIWSPMDSQVVIHTQQQDGDQAVFVLDSGHDEANEIDVLHDTFGPSITNLQWLPTGLGLVMVAGNVQDGVVMNGQLYVYRFGDPVPMLIATSGQGGPTGTISHAAVSPDGQSVAYAIMVRDLDEWHLHSLWVKPLRGGPAVAIPTTTNSPITALFWSSEGLAWQQGNGTTTIVDGSLQPRPLGEAPAATPVASPVGTPAATPVEQATPRG